MKAILIFYLGCVLFYSCTETDNKNNKQERKEANQSTKDSVKRTLHSSIDTTPVLRLTQDSIIKEKVITQSPIGEEVNDISEIIYLNQDMEVLKIEWRAETSITIMNEGPHCDLIQWKHAYTPWKEILLDSIPEHEVRLIDQFPEANQLFPAVEINEFKKYVRSHCGENWYQHIKKATSINDYPIGIGVSRIIYRINCKSKDGKKYYSKVYHQELAMGC